MVDVDLLLDPQIRLMVVGPVILITLLVQFGRHYLMSFVGRPKSDMQSVRESQILQRTQMLMMNGRFLSKEAFEMRRQFFVNDDEPSEGFLEKNKRESFQPPNPMSDPAQMNNMMMGSLSNMVPMMLVGGIINSVFSGFVMIRVPFPLTLRYKEMLQRGIQLSTLSSSWVSSASFYFICVFGLRGVMSLILGPNNDSDSMRAMQQQMMGSGMGQQANPIQLFDNRIGELKVANHKWELDLAEHKCLTAVGEGHM
eukprot:m.443101 g.443101  ORF g.443101 m.443101 type:complete len:254 (-) comp18922_c0_seq1:84-845(-)